MSIDTGSTTKDNLTTKIPTISSLDLPSSPLRLFPYRNSRLDMQPPPALVPRSKTQDLQHSLPTPLTEYHTFILLESDPPNSITRSRQFPDKRPCPRIPELDPPIVPARDDKSLIKLEAGDGVVVCAKTVNAFEGGEVEDDYSTV